MEDVRPRPSQLTLTTATASIPEIVSSEFKEVKLRLANGKEVPARFVLKDADLDLAFMAPETNDPAYRADRPT